MVVNLDTKKHLIPVEPSPTEHKRNIIWPKNQQKASISYIVDWLMLVNWPRNYTEKIIIGKTSLAKTIF